MRAVAFGAAGLAIVAASAQAQSLQPKLKAATVSPQATTDPIKVLYRVSGILDTGVNTGVSTVFSCTNFQQTSETIAFQVRSYTGTIAFNTGYTVASRETFSIATNFPKYHSVTDVMLIGVEDGAAIISATSTNVHCSAMLVPSGSATHSYGHDLHMVRFNPHPGSVE